MLTTSLFRIGYIYVIIVIILHLLRNQLNNSNMKKQLRSYLKVDAVKVGFDDEFGHEERVFELRIYSSSIHVVRYLKPDAIGRSQCFSYVYNFDSCMFDTVCNLDFEIFFSMLFKSEIEGYRKSIANVSSRTFAQENFTSLLTKYHMAETLQECVESTMKSHE